MGLLSAYAEVCSNRFVFLRRGLCLDLSPPTTASGALPKASASVDSTASWPICGAPLDSSAPEITDLGMRAIVVREPGGPEQLELRQVPDPELGEHRVLIDVKASALNRADLLQRRGKYPPPEGESPLLGLECAGVVSKVGAFVSSVKPGDRVMALLGGGGYAEKVVVHERMTLPIPALLSFEEAAAVPEAFLTAAEALLSVARLKPRERVLIHAAAGGVGSAAVQLAHQHGATVIAVAGTDEKLARVRELGAEFGINYKQHDFEEQLDGPVDVILDFIGGSHWPKHARCLSVGGRLVVLGLLGGSRADVDLGVVLRKRLQVLGLVMRTRPLSEKILLTQRFMQEHLPWFGDRRLRPVIDSVFPLAEARLAHEKMEANGNIGKIVLRVSD